MGDKKQDNDHELVGIWYEGMIWCRACAGPERIDAAYGLDRIERGAVEAGVFNYCDKCGKPLI